MTLTERNPRRVRAGKVAAVARWGAPRTVRLDALTPEWRRAVVAIIEAAKASAPRAPSLLAQEPSVPEEPGDGSR